MAKFGGFSGGMGNMQNMIKQAQKMQKDMQEKQEEVAKKEIETSAGGGAVVVKATGDKKLFDEALRKIVVMASIIHLMYTSQVCVIINVPTVLIINTVGSISKNLT